VMSAVFLHRAFPFLVICEKRRVARGYFLVVFSSGN
jgi:hypothetical protein